MGLRGGRVKVGQECLSRISMALHPKPTPIAAYLRDPHPEHHGMCIPMQSCLQQEAVSYSAGLASSSNRPRTTLPETPSENLLCLLFIA